jgi:hypothetical protein
MFSADQIKSRGCSRYDLKVESLSIYNCTATHTWLSAPVHPIGICQISNSSLRLPNVSDIATLSIDIDSTRPDHNMQSQAHLQGETSYLPALDALASNSSIKLQVSFPMACGYSAPHRNINASDSLSFFRVPLGRLTNLSLE